MMWWMAAALGSIPDGLRPAVAPVDAPALYAKALPGAAELACTPLLPKHALLCFRVWEEGKGRRWVTVDDLKRWQTTPEELQTHITPAAKTLLAHEPHPVSIKDMEEPYWTLLDGDGWAVAPWLHGDVLAAKLGGEGLRVAQPRTGVFLAWKRGSSEMDRVMAVAVREMFDGAEDAVSPMIHVWKAGRFVPFGQAKPQGG